MNQYEAFAKKMADGSALAMMRLDSEGEAKPIMRPGGKPEVFPDEASANAALLKNLLAYFNGHMVRDGEIAGRTQKAIEAQFTTPTRRPKMITVEYKGKRRAQR